MIYNTLVLFVVMVAQVMSTPCVQTSSIKYACPPFPPQTQSMPGIEENMVPKPDWGLDTYVGTNKLAGKLAIITGGDSGIGRAVALAFAREGARVVISYLNEEVDAQVTLNVVRDSGSDGLLFPGDISNETLVKYIVEQTINTYGRLDILVNNAATQHPKVEDFIDISHARILYTFQVNILAMFDFARYAIPYMKAGGVIINTASVQAYNPSWEILDYASTKGAIVTFSKGLARYTIQKGIRTNVVAPGPVWTPLIVSSFPSGQVVDFGNTSTLGRPAQPAELAPMYVDLASEKSSYVNGAVVGVNGGFFLP